MSDSEVLLKIRDTVVATATKVDVIERTVSEHTEEIQAVRESVAKLSERSHGVRRELDSAKRKGGLFGLGGGGVVVLVKTLIDRLNGGGP